MVPWDLLAGFLVDVPSMKHARSEVRVVECVDPVARVLADVGFEGRGLRTAWSVVMRESRGEADVIGHGVDYGWFQFNEPAWGDAWWWDDELLLHPYYATLAAWIVTDHGTDWSPWGLTADGHVDASAYPSWSAARVESDIEVPFRHWWDAFPGECGA